MPVDPTSLGLRFMGLADALFILIHKIIDTVLPGFLQKDLKSDAVRSQIVSAVDTALVAQEPAAAAIPQSLRQKIFATSWMSSWMMCYWAKGTPSR